MYLDISNKNDPLQKTHPTISQNAIGNPENPPKVPALSPSFQYTD